MTADPSKRPSDFDMNGCLYDIKPIESHVAQSRLVARYYALLRLNDYLWSLDSGSYASPSASPESQRIEA